LPAFSLSTCVRLSGLRHLYWMHDLAFLACSQPIIPASRDSLASTTRASPLSLELPSAVALFVARDIAVSLRSTVSEIWEPVSHLRSRSGEPSALASQPPLQPTAVLQNQNLFISVATLGVSHSFTTSLPSWILLSSTVWIFLASDRSHWCRRYIGSSGHHVADLSHLFGSGTAILLDWPGLCAHHCRREPLQLPTWISQTEGV